MKARYFFYILLLTICAVVPFEQSWTSGSSSGSPPCVEWGSWTVGQSTGSGDAKMTTFITNSEETNCVKIVVKYCATQPNTSVVPLNSYDFTITMNNGFTVEKSVKSTSGPASSELSPNTAFTIEAKLKGPKDTTGAKSCDSQNGRKNVPMKVTVTFTGSYGTEPNNQQSITPLTKTWKQDGIDLIRQEYVDMTPTGGRAELPVPGYSDFVTTISGNGNDGWNTGHYGYMIDDGLKNKKSSWLTEVNKYRTEKKLSTVTDNQFKVNSAYRNPYHQRFHVSAPYTASFHSRHCYGDALDVKTFDVDGDGTVEQKKLRISNGATDAQKAKLRADALKYSDDAAKLQELAITAGAKWTASWEYYTTHTHADWTERGWAKWPPKAGTVYSTPCPGPSGTDNSSTSLTTTTTVACEKQNENSCNVLVSSSSAHYVTCPGSNCGDAYWSCDSEDYNEHRLRTCTWQRLPGGDFCFETWRLCKYRPERIRGTNLHTQGPLCPTDPNGFRYCADKSTNTTPPNTITYACGVHTGDASLASSHLLQASCSGTDSHGQYCTVTSFYACASHTHQYPALIAGACGHSYTSSASYNHRSETCPTNSNGHACTSGYSYVCQSHTHVYPRVCWRSACNVIVSDAAEHKETCGSGAHSFWPGCPDLNVRSWHQHRYHQLRNCSRCGSQFRLCSNNDNSCSNGRNHRK